MAKTIGDITIQRYPSGRINLTQSGNVFSVSEETISLSPEQTKEVATELTRLSEKKIE